MERGLVSNSKSEEQSHLILIYLKMKAKKLTYRT